MNLLISWGYEINGKAFKGLLRDLDVKYCACITEGETIKEFDEGIKHDEINPYIAFDCYKENIENRIPLDAEILLKMTKYEIVAMDIIYRWRRSISIKNDYKEIKNIYYIYLRYWNDFIIKKGINCLILFNTPHIPITYILYCLCKIYNIPVIVQIKMANIGRGLQNKYLTTDIDEVEPNFLKRFKINSLKYKNINTKDIILCEGFEEYFEEYSKENSDINRVILFEPKKSASERILLYWDRTKIYLSQKRYRILAKKIKYLIMTKYISNNILHFASKIEVVPDLDSKYLFFPLHFQPEATTLPHAGFYTDQLLIIQMISSSLTNNAFLYVKEHPAYWKQKERYECVSEARSEEFYKSIRKLNNVKLIRHELSSLEMIDRCQALVTCTGTASLEAVFKGKPVLMYGDICYKHLPGVHRIFNTEDCKKAINEIFQNNNTSNDLRNIKMFFKTLESTAVTVGILEGEKDNFDDNTISLSLSAERTRKAITKFIEEFYPNSIK